MEYSVINLRNIYNTIGEKETEKLMSGFSCNLNPDIENFLKTKSIEFSKKSVAETFIVTTSYQEKPIIVGYFSLAYKITMIKKDILKGKMKNRLLRFSQIDKDKNYYLVPLPLIGQISKNFENNYDKLITGDELLRLACQKVKEAQEIIGGRFVFLECADNPKLKQFYEDNGFVYFGERELDRDEKKHNVGTSLLKMLCDLSDIDT